MAEGYERFTIIWADRRISVSYRANWLRTSYWHIELRCDERLPVTQTGYRSIFVPEADLVNEAAITDFVIAALDQAALSKAWHDYLQASRQLDLF